MKISIYSCFGRGNWLAVELAQSGMEVTLVDLSAAFRHWTPGDWEGPFGFFHSDQVSTSQFARLNEEDYSELVDSGFSILLPDGPLELKGPLSKYLLQKSGLDLAVVDELKTGQVESAKTGRDKTFKQTWLAHLASQMASNQYRPNADSIGDIKPLPVFSPYYVRRVTRRGYTRGLEWIRERGVEVINADKLEAVEGEGRKLEVLRVSEAGSPKPQMADQHVWMLTGEESVFLGLKNPERFYPQGVVLPEWAWIRMSLQLSDGPYLEILPNKFVLIGDNHLPWTHENFQLVQRGVSSQEVDIWLRVPNSQRFRREYLEEVVGKAQKLFDRRVPDAHSELGRYPQEHRYDVTALGPTRFPVYSGEELQAKPPFRWENLVFDSPEQWPRLDWTGMFSHQRQTFEAMKTRLEKWRKTQAPKEESVT